MAQITFMTASTLKAILCYIDPKNTPKIAYDRDDLAEELIAKIKEAVGNHDGSESVSINFDWSEGELERQFLGVCKNISFIFDDLSHMFKN
jgi:hypothetical protein